MQIFKENITSAAPYSVIGTIGDIKVIKPKQQKVNDHSIDYANSIVTVILTRGYWATVSLEDWAWMRFMSWFAMASDTMSRSVYMATSAKIGKRKRVILLAHRMIADKTLPDGKNTRIVVDHADTNTLNNTRENLSVRSRLANSHNRTRPNRNSSTGKLNVCPYGDKFKVVVKINRQLFYWLGFPTLKSAVKFRDKTLPRLRSTLIKGAN